MEAVSKRKQNDVINWSESRSGNTIPDAAFANPDDFETQATQQAMQIIESRITLSA